MSDLYTDLLEYCDEISEEVDSEIEDLKEASKLAHNSFGHGYSDGRLTTLREVLDKLREMVAR